MIHDRPTTDHAPSRAAVFKHPIHPMLVNYPIALLTACLPADLAYWWSGDPFWAHVAFWLVAVGLGLGLVAIVAGIVDFLLIKHVRRQMAAWHHALAGICVIAFASADLSLRLGDPVAAVLPWGLVMSVLTAGAVLVAGWLGGTLTFRYSIGSYGEPVRDDEPDDDSAEGRPVEAAGETAEGDGRSAVLPAGTAAAAAGGAGNRRRS